MNLSLMSLGELSRLATRGASPNYSRSTVPRHKMFHIKNNIKEGSWVIVKYGETNKLYFVKIIQILQKGELYEGSLTRSSNFSSSYNSEIKEPIYIFPDIIDFYTFKLEDIVLTVPQPKSLRRVRMQFTVKLKGAYMLLLKNANLLFKHLFKNTKKCVMAYEISISYLRDIKAKLVRPLTMPRVEGNADATMTVTRVRKCTNDAFEMLLHILKFVSEFATTTTRTPGFTQKATTRRKQETHHNI
ncbi:hypothetical protein AGLY_013907 [Aphis glycines]|uniref:Uncharacterized protein n=1 Tax=Aphis glycines TaxID=307491 RepID=A0A6G0T6Y9_APHGL|nr:hypothetical protein AGLY_013907 [Aphis glycines]